jgi:hypothetical protein
MAADDIDGHRSTIGVLFFLSSSLVTWLSAAAQATWLRSLLEEMTDVSVPRSTINMDNMAAIALAKNPILHDHSKHIGVKFHYTRECVEQGDIELKHIGTTEELADTLTKALKAKRFHELQEKIGVVRVSTIKKQK